MIINKANTGNFGRSLRFKRWTRTGFAVFASITACVSIGQVKASVADCLLKKQEYVSDAKKAALIPESCPDHKTVTDVTAFEAVSDLKYPFPITVSDKISQCKSEINLNKILITTSPRLMHGPILHQPFLFSFFR